MEVGDRIRVFEILKNGSYLGVKMEGLQRSEKKGKFFGNKHGVDLFTDDLHNYEFEHHVNIDNDIVNCNHIKQVCTMVIKSIKNA